MDNSYQTNQYNVNQNSFNDASDPLYESSGNKFLRTVLYYWGKIWPYIKNIGTEILYYAFKSGRAAVRFALIQIGLKRE